MMSNLIELKSETTEQITEKEKIEFSNNIVIPEEKEEKSEPKRIIKSKKFKNYMQDHSRLLLHTWDAQSLAKYSSNGVSHFWQFKRFLRALWKAHKLDNPYADHFLVKSYRAYVAAVKKLNTGEKLMMELFQKLDGIEWELCSNPEPMKLRYQSLTPLDFIAMRLLQELDRLTRQMLTLKRFGFLAELQQLSTENYSQIVRSVFHVPEEWQGVEVTRADLRDNNEKAQRAKAMFGELPRKLLEKQFDFGYWSWGNNLGKQGGA